MSHKVHCRIVALSLLQMEKRILVFVLQTELDRACLQPYTHAYIVNNFECTTQSSRCSFPAEDPMIFFWKHWQDSQILRVKADEKTTSKVTIADWILFCLAHLLLICLLCRYYSYKYTNELYWGVRIAGTCLTLMMNKWKHWFLLLLKKG